VFIGTAGWSVPRASAHRCAGEGTHLERYARVFPCAEINSSFHRPHSASTYAKWAAGTVPEFRFSVKAPRLITHDQKLRRARAPLERFFDEIAGLGKKRGPLLIQLPPSLEFRPRVANNFFTLLRDGYRYPIVCEPRHETWFSPSAEALLLRYKIARVAADPPPVDGADAPAGWPGVVYYRLHGSPRKYWSRYDAAYVARLADAIRGVPSNVDAWVIFDNTASGAAFENACDLQEELAGTFNAGTPRHRVNT
jgi:uncharacterized protein YecE (DUF72 family)